MSDRNERIIEEFRENDGQVGGHFADHPLLILHTTGAKTEKERVNPVAAFEEGEKLYVIASKGGAPTHPDWYHNLRANPIVEVEYGTETFKAKAKVAEEPKRSELYEKAAEQFSAFEEYPKKTDRVIPVVLLEPLS